MAESEAMTQAIIAAALDEFTVHGYAAASLNTIIERAHVSKGSFYYRYPSKEELYLSLIDYVVGVRLEFLQARTGEETGAPPAGLFAILESQAKLSVDFSLNHPKLMQFTLKVVNDGPTGPLAAKVRERLSGKLDDMLIPLLRSAVAAGELRGDLGEAFVAKLLSHLLFSFGPLFVPAGEAPDRERIYADLERYFDFIRNGLSPTISPKTATKRGSQA